MRSVASTETFPALSRNFACAMIVALAVVARSARSRVKGLW